MTRGAPGGIQPTTGLRLFSVLGNAGSLIAAARKLGIATPAIGKHQGPMASRLGLSLANRATRRMSLTSEGELHLGQARRIPASPRFDAAHLGSNGRHMAALRRKLSRRARVPRYFGGTRAGADLAFQLQQVEVAVKPPGMQNALRCRAFAGATLGGRHPSHGGDDYRQHAAGQGVSDLVSVSYRSALLPHRLEPGERRSTCSADHLSTRPVDAFFRLASSADLVLCQACR